MITRVARNLKPSKGSELDLALKFCMMSPFYLPDPYHIPPPLSLRLDLKIAVTSQWITMVSQWTGIGKPGETGKTSMIGKFHETNLVWEPGCVTPRRPWWAYLWNPWCLHGRKRAGWNPWWLHGRKRTGMEPLWNSSAAVFVWNCFRNPGYWDAVTVSVASKCLNNIVLGDCATWRYMIPFLWLCVHHYKTMHTLHAV